MRILVTTKKGEMYIISPVCDIFTLLEFMFAVGYISVVFLPPFERGVVFLF